jgi:hypothetical protein
MGILEDVMELKKGGKSEEEISLELEGRGYPPLDISNAINQSKIKSAISYEPENNMEEETYQPPQQEQYSEQTPRIDEASEEYYPQQEGGYQEGYSQGGYDTDTIIEISKQVFSEKIRKNQKDTEENTEFRNIAKVKIEHLEERIKKIEDIIDKLQLAILDKVGSYGDNLEQIKKEMSIVEDSLRKVIDKKRPTSRKKK